MRALVALLLALVVWAHSSAARAQAPGEGAPAEPPAEPPSNDQEYRRHLAMGVELYNAQNYDGAIAEFKAAYDLDPKAAPLVNLALSYKKRFEYAEALAALEKALSQHADSLAPDQKAAAELEIQALRAKIAWVSVRIEPAIEAVELTVDEKPAKLDGPLALSPGTHRFVARAAGYGDAVARAELVAGTKNQPVVLRLGVVSGRVSVRAAQPTGIIEVDNKPEAKGKWDGLLAPGVHSVTVHTPGSESRTLRIAVVAGGQHEVTQKDDGTLDSDAALSGPAPPPPPGKSGRDFGVDVPRALFGFYGLGGASLLTVFSSSEPLERVKGGSVLGGGVGLNVGYRVANWAAFEVMVHASDVSIGGTLHGVTGDVPDVKYALQSLRLGPAFRVMLPGTARGRFVGGVGLGLLLERFEWRGDNAGAAIALVPEDDGAAFFGQLEAGVEMEFSNILIDLVAQNSIQTTKHLGGLFDEEVVVVFGPSVRVGYGLW